MSDHPQLLHNMSAPPRSKIKMPERYGDRVVLQVALQKKIRDAENIPLALLREIDSDANPEEFDSIVDTYFRNFNLTQMCPIVPRFKNITHIFPLPALLSAGILLHSTPTLIIPKRRIPTTRTALRRSFFVTNPSFLRDIHERCNYFPEILSTQQKRLLSAYLKKIS